MGIIYGPNTIEGGIGPYVGATEPIEGTDETQTLTIGGTPTGGDFKLAFQGFVTPAIDWDSTTSTFLANINTGLQGLAAVQLLSFINITSGTFRLRYRGQTTAVITWSSVNTTLRDRIDTALEALPNIGVSGVACAVVTSGTAPALVTISVTFAAFEPQPLIEITDVRVVRDDDTITDPTISAATTTAGIQMPSIGKLGVVATDVDLVAGIGGALLTFSGANLAAKAQPLITVAENALTGTDPTVAIAETTPGVTAAFRGALPGAEAVDIVAAIRYVNEGTAQAPTWESVAAGA